MILTAGQVHEATQATVAAAGVRSMTRPRTNGPLSLMVTTADLPLLLLDDLRRPLSSTATASAPAASVSFTSNAARRAVRSLSSRSSAATGFSAFRFNRTTINLLAGAKAAAPSPRCQVQTSIRAPTRQDRAKNRSNQATEG